jgi:hypothetical protein
MPTSLKSSNVTFPDGTTQTTARGARTLLTTLTASSSASLSYTGFSDSYNNYELLVYNMMSATLNVGFYMRYYFDGGFNSGTYYSTGVWINQYATTGSPPFVPASGYAGIGGSVGYIPLTYSNYAFNGSSAGVSGMIRFTNCRNTSSSKNYNFVLSGMDYTTNYAALTFGGGTHSSSTSKLDGFQIYYSSGNIQAGTIRVYGWN